MVTDKSKENLKPFKKGKDPRRNTKGSKALPDLKELLEELGDEGMKEVVKALHAQAKKGNVKAIQEVFDRYYGKVRQDLNLSGEVKQVTQPDLSNLSEKEKKEFGKLRKKANGIND